MVFPAVHGIDASVGREIEALSRDHVEMLHHLEAVGASLTTPEAVRMLEAFATRMCDDEEKLVGSVVESGVAPSR